MTGIPAVVADMRLLFELLMVVYTAGSEPGRSKGLGIAAAAPAQTWCVALTLVWFVRGKRGSLGGVETVTPCRKKSAQGQRGES
jgi:hypothetical protein